MTCHSSSVPITPTSASQVDDADPQEAAATRARTRRPDRVSRTASATIDASTQTHAEHHHRQLQRGRRRDEPGVDVDAGGQPRLGGHLQVGEDARDLRLLLRRPGCRSRRGCRRSRRRPARRWPRCAARCSAPEATAGRGATAATESRNATNDDVGGGADEQAVAAGVDAGRRDGREHQAARRGQRGDGLARDRRRRGPAVRRTPAAR